MCLGVPGLILSVRENGEDDPWQRMGKVDFAGVRKDVNLAYVPEAEAGDYVVVHVGFAISRIDEEAAREVFAYLQSIGEDREPGRDGNI